MSKDARLQVLLNELEECYRNNFPQIQRRKIIQELNKLSIDQSLELIEYIADHQTINQIYTPPVSFFREKISELFTSKEVQSEKQKLVYLGLKTCKACNSTGRINCAEKDSDLTNINSYKKVFLCACENSVKAIHFYGDNFQKMAPEDIKRYVPEYKLVISKYKGSWEVYFDSVIQENIDNSKEGSRLNTKVETKTKFKSLTSIDLKKLDQLNKKVAK